MYQRQREESEVEAGEDDAVSEAGVRDVSLEPATRDVSLEEEQHTQDKQPVVKEEVEEQPTRVPPIDKMSEGDPSEIFVPVVPVSPFSTRRKALCKT